MPKKTNGGKQPQSKKRAYKLYAVRNEAEGLKAIAGQPYSRITPEYGLVYTDGKVPENCVRIDGEDLKRLTDGDRAWLFSCNITLLAAEAGKQIEQVGARMCELMDSLESALKAERRWASGEK